VSIQRNRLGLSTLALGLAAATLSIPTSAVDPAGAADPGVEAADSAGRASIFPTTISLP
jgi:hypothetical protein